MNKINFASKISAVEFYPLSEDEIKERAVVAVTNKNQFNDKGPEPHGIYDSRMGTIYSRYDCATCEQGVRKCIGHWGRYELKYPVCYPIYVATAIKFLKVICVYCFRFIMNPDKPEYKYVTQSKVDNALNFILEAKVNKGDSKKKIFCDYCNEGRNNIQFVQPKYTASANDQNHIKVRRAHSGEEYKFESDANDYERIVYNYEILRIFESLPYSELTKFNIPRQCHPRNYYTRQLLILPPNLRFINNDNKNSYSNQLTTCIDKIIKENMAIPGEIPAKKNTSAFGIYMNQVDRMIKEFLEYQKAKTGSDSNDNIYRKLTGKKGQIRGNQLGKNVGKVFRCVIVCDISCPIDTIKIPRAFAQILTVEETVTEYNKERMMKIFANGNNYPGFNEVYSISKKCKFDARNTNYKLQVGDILSRHLVDGDTVPFHRFPTLTASCTTSMKIIVHRDNSSAVAFNVAACAWFNADYDGDTMMGFLVGHEGIRFEADYIMNMNNNYLEGKVTADGSNMPILGQVLDTVIGFALITRHGVEFTRYEVMDLIKDVQINKPLTKKVYTGREVMSLVMPRIKYVAPSPFFANKLVNQFLDFHESDKEIRIIDGQILSGIVCGSAIKSSPGSIYHLIYDQYGSKVAHKTIFYHQQIIQRYLELEVFSIGYRDLILTQESRDMIDLVQNRIMTQLKELQNKIMNKNIIPPLGKSMKNYIDELILGIHANSADAYFVSILKGCNPQQNALVWSVLAGAKGKWNNIFSMLANVGQKKSDGKRWPNKLGYMHYSIWNQQFSLEPTVGGYISKSFVGGIPHGPEMYTCSMDARQVVLTKGLVTGEGGAAGRDLIKVMESLKVDNRLWVVRGHGENIVEFSVADDGYESSTLIANPYFILEKSDDDVRQMFAPQKFKSKAASKIIDEIIADKKQFVAVQQSKEFINYTHDCSKNLMVPFNINQMIYIVTDDKVHEPSDKEYAEMLDYLSGYLDTIHYIKINSVHREKKTQLLKSTILTLTAIKMALRLYFNPVFLERCSMEWLKVLLHNISCKILEVLHLPGKNIGVIHGQTLTAPLTQYLIDASHASVTGGTSRDGLKYFKQMGNLKEAKKMPDNVKRMYIFLKEKYETDESVAQALADHIGTIKFDSLLLSLEILAEKYGECITHPEDRALYGSSAKNSALQKIDKYPLVFRYTMNKDFMYSKNITIMKVVAKIEQYYGGLVYCVEGMVGDKLILHVYFANQFDFIYDKEHKSKKLITAWEKIAIYAQKFAASFIINDLDGIYGVTVKSRQRTIMNADGSIAKKKIFYVQTNGINMKDVLLINVVDKYRTYCSHVLEAYKYLGMIAARNVFISEISNTFITLKLAHNNYIFAANVMFERGYPLNLTEKGQKVREQHDVLLHSAYRNPINSIHYSAVNGIDNALVSPSANLMMGQFSDFGTDYNQLVFNIDKLAAINAANKTSEEDLLDKL